MSKGMVDAPIENDTKPPLGEYLVRRGKLTSAGLNRALRLQEDNGERLEMILTRLGLIAERDLAEMLAGYLNLPLIAGSAFPTAPVLEAAISRRFLREHRAIPIRDTEEGLELAMADPLDDYTADAVQIAAHKRVLRCVALPADIDTAYQRLYGEGKSSFDQINEEAVAGDNQDADEDVERLRDLASDAPVIRLVNHLIVQAVEARASDIHIEPSDAHLRIRYRIDGILQEMESPPNHLRSAIVSRVKIMARLNIAERRLAQDGRIRLAVRGRDIDIRVSTTPTLHGESVVLRLLNRDSLPLDFAALGFDTGIIESYRRILQQPHGILLVTGPTGSGKTTTLYASLLTLNTPKNKILTIEDPIEYQLEGINQVQVKPQIGLTFANALRSFLRQDPDIMMVGEIRDLETAQIAVQAALTGHLILSTLHTNDAASAVTRLLDMGVEDYLLTSTINGLVGQRLVRRLCEHCRQPYQAIPALVQKMRLSESECVARMTLFRSVGCDRCNGTGYLGRTTILEVLHLTDRVRQLVLEHAEARVIQRAAVDEGMQTMYQHGMSKVLAGVTTVEEVLRVTRDV